MGAIKETTNITINHDTGEVIEESNVRNLAVEFEPKYIKMYVEDIARISGLGGTAGNIILAIARRMGSRNEVALVRGIKKTIALECGVKLKTVDNTILLLKEKKLLIALPERSCYILDPHLFSRESWKENKALRLQVTYLPDYNRKVIQASIPNDVQPELPFDKTEALPRQGWED